MNSNDLFDIIGETPAGYLLEAANGAGEQQEGNRPSVRRLLLIAAIIALGLLLMGSAIAALVKMRVEPVVLNVQNHTEAASEGEEPQGKDHEGERVNFDEVRDVFLELGSYYPQQIPEGYTRTFVSQGAPLENQVIHYENDGDGLITFWIHIAHEASGVEIFDIRSKKDVTIQGKPGILYEHGEAAQTLVWVDEANGYGFVLRANDPAVDLVAMAESTAEGEKLVPTRSESTVKALEELGDFSPAYLPEGYEENGVVGSPLEEGGGWYSYVNKYYVNKAENTRIYFEYESYVIDTEAGYTDDARTVCYFLIPGGHMIEKGQAVGEEVEVAGMYGIAIETDIAWADPETHRVFHIHSEDVTGEELLKVAQSISEE